MEKRPSKTEHYLTIAKEVAQRSTCFRVKIGTIIVRDDVIVATGYIGAPRKTKDCFDRGECLRNKLKIPHGERYELCRSVHSEMNALINASRVGVSLLGGDMYIWGANREGKPINAFPCFICKKMIINAALNKVICAKSDGSYEIFSVNDWVKEWQERDILDDKDQYGQDQAI